MNSVFPMSHRDAGGSCCGSIGEVFQNHSRIESVTTWPCARRGKWRLPHTNSHASYINPLVLSAPYHTLPDWYFTHPLHEHAKHVPHTARVEVTPRSQQASPVATSRRRAVIVLLQRRERTRNALSKGTTNIPPCPELDRCQSYMVLVSLRG